MTKRILIDAREFKKSRFTGIGRALVGIIDSLEGSNLNLKMVLAAGDKDTIPPKFHNKTKISIKKVPNSFLASEKALSDISRQGFKLFISPYPKLPLFGSHCKSINTIHDVLDLTHEAYKNRPGVLFDKFRLKSAIKSASLTWYDSSWSQKETSQLTGLSGKNPRVRYPGVDELFSTRNKVDHQNILKKYKLESGYILICGNGKSHKNLDVLLRSKGSISRQLVFVGVSEINMKYWKRKCNTANTVWIRHIIEEDLPTVIRGAFCLAQPSTAEGYGYPPLEAMSCGIPAIVSNIPVFVETTGGNAMIADPQKCQEWIQAFKALEDRSFYQKQVAKGLKWVEPLRGRKGWEKHISDIEELIN